MNKLVALTADGKVNMSRTIDQFVFDFFVKRKSSLTTCLSEFEKQIIKDNRLNYNRAWFNQSRLEENLFETWNKFSAQKRMRMAKNLKGNSLTEIALNLFNQSKTTRIFISQSACAEVLQTNQMSISREIKELINKGILVLVERGSNLKKTCSVYQLGKTGLDLFNSMFKRVIEKVKEISIEEKAALLQSLKQLKETMRLGAKSFLEVPKTKENLAVEDTLEWRRIFEGRSYERHV